MSGPYLPTTGEIPTEATVIRDGDEVLVCGVRLSEEQARAVAIRLNGTLMQIRVEREQAERQAREDRRRRGWAAGAVAVVEAPGGVPVRLVPDGRVDTEWGGLPFRHITATINALLAACPEPRRLWWLGSRGMMHLEECGCCIGRSLSDARLLPVNEVPPKVCKRSARKLAEVTP